MATSPFEPRPINADDRWPDLAKFDTVVLANPGDLDRQDADALAEFVERGGDLLVFCGENDRFRIFRCPS